MPYCSTKFPRLRKSYVSQRSRALGAFALLSVFAVVTATAQNYEGPQPPIIDVHFHGALGAQQGAEPMCPNEPGFAASDPATTEARNGWVKVPCSNPIVPVPPGEYLKAVAADMKRLNVTAVVYGNADSIPKYEEAAPGRIIPGTTFTGARDAPNRPVKDVDADFASGKYKVMGEIGLQSRGLSPSDPSVDQYFAIAEKYDVPVAIHMGTGGSGRANITMPKFRGSLGDPLLLEELLAKHPKLRVQVMHAGYPMIDNMLTLLQANSHVYVDIAGLIWSYPLVEVNRYIQRLVEAGFEDRVMFGTDLGESGWEGLLPYSISIIQNAEYLTPQEKRDILFNNAVRFYRLDVSKLAK
jgi:predicted TIM-barrel fold metal-dependent hydrolase